MQVKIHIFDANGNWLGYAVRVGSVYHVYDKNGNQVTVVPAETTVKVVADLLGE